jgi:hypothetical protein
MAQQKDEMAHQKMAHLRKMEHQKVVLHDGYRSMSLEASPCSLEPHRMTHKKTQKTISKKVKSDER